MDFHSTCKYSLTIICMLSSLNAILFDNFGPLTWLKSHLILKYNKIQINVLIYKTEFLLSLSSRTVREPFEIEHR